VGRAAILLLPSDEVDDCLDDTGKGLGFPARLLMLLPREVKGGGGGGGGGAAVEVCATLGYCRGSVGSSKSSAKEARFLCGRSGHC